MIEKVVCAPTFDSEVLVEEGSMEAFDEAVQLLLVDSGESVLDVFESLEQFVSILAKTAAEFASVGVVTRERDIAAMRMWSCRLYV
jgi:hypothetical protein